MNRVRVEGEMTIPRIGELMHLFECELESGGDCEVDLAAVSEFDTAGFQLLMLAERVVRARGGALRIGAESAAVSRVLDLYAVGAIESARRARPESGEAAAHDSAGQPEANHDGGESRGAG